jgi:tetracycline 7-halogenase / FADH2 O2-dependent halogenase
MNTNMAETSCDVLIIGASMAGSCLARQLKLKHPELAITVIDKKKAFDYGIGESMLEVFWEYASKDLMLGPYLDSNFLAKNGLRFFFDSPEKNLKLSDMSEMGRAWIDSIPAHQINRKQFDEDMCRMNRELGIDVSLGCGAEEIVLDRAAGHVVRTSGGKSIRCKWLVDAAGFNAPLARQLDLVRPMANYQVSSRWGRFKNINAIDHLGPEEWRERVNFNSRFLSTNHFMYRGYWIWLIPLEQDLFSIGVVWRHDLVELEIKSAGDYVEFLRGHRGVAELLGDSFELVDYHGLKNMSRMSDQMYSTDRWFLTGMSAAFLDPLFSGGSAFMSESNRMIVDLIETDMAGDAHALKNKVTCYNAHSRWWLENFLLHIKGNYHGSFDLMRHLFEPLLMDYFGLILPFAMAKIWGYDPAIDYGDGSELRRMKTAMVEEGATMRVHGIINEFAEFLKEHEGVFYNNVGKFFDVKITKSYIRHSHSRGKSLSPASIGELQREMLEQTAGLALSRMAKSSGRYLSDELLSMAVADVVDDGSSLIDAFDRFSSIDESTVMALTQDRRMTDVAIGQRPN